MGFRFLPVPGLRPVCAARISDGGRLRHFHTDVGIVCAAPAVPAPVFPREQLVHIPVWLYDGMDAGGCLCPVPVLHKYICLWLRASNRMDHKTFYGDVFPGFIAAGLCKVILYQIHSISLSFRTKKAPPQRCPSKNYPVIFPSVSAWRGTPALPSFSAGVSICGWMPLWYGSSTSRRNPPACTSRASPFHRMPSSLSPPFLYSGFPGHRHVRSGRA